MSKSLFSSLLLCFSILFSAASLNAQVLVLSPHPDDDLVASAGVIYRAVQRGEAVRVVYMTNGDFDGQSTGYTRQGEAVAGQSVLGVPENNLIFLGYPDGYLDQIYSNYINPGNVFVTPNNGLSQTYGNRGLGGMDYHSYRFGSPALYNRANILADLEDILTTFMPQHIFVTSEFDAHPDHSTTYQLLRLALASVQASNPGYFPVIDKTIIHWLDNSNLTWPNAIDPTAFFAEIPDLSETTSLSWSARESLDAPLPMQSTNFAANAKYLAIACQVSQGGATGSLGQFIHKDEIFWAENPLGGNQPPIVNAGSDQSVTQGVTVNLDGTQSSDPDGDALSFQWVQRDGAPVQLSNPNSATPSFTAPSNLSQNEVLTFELVVSDYQFSSAPDAVSVTILSGNPAPTNVAPLATVTASSQNPQTGQTAAKAVDGVIDGYPGDYTREWATNSQGVGAWLQLSWAVPYTVTQIILYDRPNPNDQILNATITFSDGSSLPVGPLNNNGAATTYSFPAKVITGLKMTVTGVSSSTLNIGLAEIQVYGTSVSAPYTLNVNASPPGSGSVTVSPVQANYFQGQQVTLTPTPNAGYAFGSWSGDATGAANPLTLTINGSTNVTANFAALPGTLSVSPSSALSAAGAPGGPFAPSSAAYTLQNTGNTSIDWSASATQNWVALSTNSGTLAPGANTTVTVSIGAAAANLAAGSYSDAVTFTNLTNGNGNTTRAVTLTIAQQTANIAPLATVTASSQNAQTGQTAAKAVDGCIDGYPGNYACEWATVSQGVGAWLTLSWSVPYIVNQIVLYDRPNSNDQITSATITFTDGSSLPVGPLNNNGTATTYTFPAKVISGMTMTVTGVSSSTQNIGLAEIQVSGSPSGQSLYNLTVGSSPPGAGSVNVSPNQTSYYQGQQVTLTANPGTGYAFGSWSGDANGTLNPLTITMSGDRSVTANFVAIPGSLAVAPAGGLTASGVPGGPFSPSSAGYTLQNIGNSSIDWSASATQNWVALSSNGGTLAPGANTTVTVSIGANAANLAAGSYSDTVTFTNLTNGNGNTTRAVALAISLQTANIAPLATVTASSQNAQTGQTAAKAVDGCIDGYPGNYTCEWATNGQGAGAWLGLSWPSSYTVNQIVLYDRPNLNDQILSATITFSDGSSLPVGPLNNDGTATTYTFPARTINGLTMTVTGVSSRTLNIGLAEIQVFGY